MDMLNSWKSFVNGRRVVENVGNVEEDFCEKFEGDEKFVEDYFKF